VNSGGCSGYQYEFKMDRDKNLKIEKDADGNDIGDVVFEQEGVRMVTDTLSLSFLTDCEIDYTTSMIRSSFAVTKNTSADAACGCGASFSVMSEF